MSDNRKMNRLSICAVVISALALLISGLGFYSSYKSQQHNQIFDKIKNLETNINAASTTINTLKNNDEDVSDLIIYLYNAQTFKNQADFLFSRDDYEGVQLCINEAYDNTRKILQAPLKINITDESPTIYVTAYVYPQIPIESNTQSNGVTVTSIPSFIGGRLNLDTTVTLTQKDGSIVDTATLIMASLPTDFDYKGYCVSAFELYPDDASFNKQVKLTISYDPSLIPIGYDINQFKIYGINSGNLYLYDNPLVDFYNHTITIRIKTLGTFVVIAPPLKTTFKITSNMIIFSAISFICIFCICIAIYFSLRFKKSTKIQTQIQSENTILKNQIKDLQDKINNQNP
jgi:hypothetical protein